MATCARCRQSHFGMLDLKAGFCKNCRQEIETEEQALKDRRKNIPNPTDLKSIIITTEAHVDFEIIERLGVVSAECAFGMNAFKDLFAGVRDIVGGRSATVQKVMRESRKVVLEELRLEASELGADAIVGASFNYVELSSTGSMLLLVGTGTAVSTK